MYVDCTLSGSKIFPSGVPGHVAYLQRVPVKGGLQCWVAASAVARASRRSPTPSPSRASSRPKYGSLTNRQFVTRIYTDVPGRTADTAGVDHWTGTLDRKERTRGQVMVGFSESSECKCKKATSVDVTVTWISLLQAPPTKTAFDEAVADIAGGGLSSAWPRTWWPTPATSLGSDPQSARVTGSSNVGGASGRWSRSSARAP